MKGGRTNEVGESEEGGSDIGVKGDDKRRNKIK